MGWKGGGGRVRGGWGGEGVGGGGGVKEWGCLGMEGKWGGKVGGRVNRGERGIGKK